MVGTKNRLNSRKEKQGSPFCFLIDAVGFAGLFFLPVVIFLQAGICHCNARSAWPCFRKYLHKKSDWHKPKNNERLIESLSKKSDEE